MATAILDSLAAIVALVGPDGQILFVNRRWMDFTRENGCQDLSRIGVGTNYFTVCGNAGGESAENAEQVRDGLRAVLDGRQDLFEAEYRCDSPAEERWFSVQISPFAPIDPRGAVVAHHNVTFRRKLLFDEQEERDSQARATEMSSLRRLSEERRTPLTAQSFGLEPIHHADPAMFLRLVRAYEDLMDQAVDERIFRRGTQMSEPLRLIAAQLGGNAASPRDVVGIHCEALRAKTADVPPAKAAVYQEESRMLLVELMGHLVSYYRNTRAGIHSSNRLPGLN
jgi:hypothetical protein